MAISKKLAEHMSAGLKRLVPIIQQQRARDVSEADTVPALPTTKAEVSFRSSLRTAQRTCTLTFRQALLRT
jgi:hypothetical protein